MGNRIWGLVCGGREGPSRYELRRLGWTEKVWTVRWIGFLRVIVVFEVDVDVDELKPLYDFHSEELKITRPNVGLNLRVLRRDQFRFEQ